MHTYKHSPRIGVLVEFPNLMYVYMYVWMYVCMYLCMYICKYVCTYVWMYVWEAKRDVGEHVLGF